MTTLVHVVTSLVLLFMLGCLLAVAGIGAAMWWDDRARARARRAHDVIYAKKLGQRLIEKPMSAEQLRRVR